MNAPRALMLALVLALAPLVGAGTAAAHWCSSAEVDGCGPCEDDGADHDHFEPDPSTGSEMAYRCSSEGNEVDRIVWIVKDLVSELLPGDLPASLTELIEDVLDTQTRA